MRDVMAALASAATLNQTLEIILVNLRNVIPYDRAGFVLLDENRLGRAQGLGRQPGGEPLRAYPAHDPVIADLLRHKRPIRVHDVAADPRFGGWNDLDPVRGWLGAPLQVQNEIIGFLSLGSLQPNAYTTQHAEILQTFTAEVSQVLERVWQLEESNRKSKQLETLSRMTVALGQLKSQEETVAAVVDQVTLFFGAERGTFLIPEAGRSAFVVRYSQTEALNGLRHPPGEDPIWAVSRAGQALAIHPDHAGEIDLSQPVYQALCHEMYAVMLIPLKTEKVTFGVLAFSFANPQTFSQATVPQYNAVAELVGSALRRAIALERLEEQNRVRTQHLATLYRINALANESLDLLTLLEQTLTITLEALGCSMAALHLLDPEEAALHLVIERRLPPAVRAELETVQLSADFWRELIDAHVPTYRADISRDALAPPALSAQRLNEQKAFLAAPVRVNNQALGLLSLFSAAHTHFSIEDTTLLTTITDQMGGFIERARLVSRAEQTAVMQERQRLARELHDSVTQLLYSQVLFADAGRKVLAQNNDLLAEQYLGRLSAGAQQALKEMRLLVYELRPIDFLGEGLASALLRRLEGVEKRTGLQVQLDIEPGLHLAPQLEAGLYGIAQEALNNTLKHAHATNVAIRLFAYESGVQMEISDDGDGFNVEVGQKSGGMGLGNMQERAMALGGRLSIDSTPAQGTNIRVRIEAQHE